MLRKSFAFSLGTLVVLILAAVGTTARSSEAAQSPMGAAFTYQGRLVDAGSVATGAYDFEFKLFDAQTAGMQLGSTVGQTIDVVDGYFTTQLDFGEIFNGDARFLEIAVRLSGSGDPFTLLDPRQALTPVPYALALPGLWTQQDPTSPNLIGGYSGNAVAPGVVGGTIGGGGASDGLNTVAANYGTIAGGIRNTVSAQYGTVGGGVENVANGTATVGGGYANHAGGSLGTIGGGSYNWIGPAAEAATIGGGGGNGATGPGATVSGGFDNHATAWSATIAGGTNNEALGEHATVGGGKCNQALAKYATIAGGGTVDASCDTGNRVTDPYGTVGGGGNNQAGNANSNQFDATVATVGGGMYNVASGGSATISGGYANTASGGYATIGGGMGNQVAGMFATIGGGGRSDQDDPATGNRVTDDYGTVSGGGRNQAGDGDADATNRIYAAVGGGESNNASGRHSTVGGGQLNAAGGEWATVAGGGGNTANGGGAAIGGGLGNIADGALSSIPGGYAAKTVFYGQIAHASGAFAATGDAQTSVYLFRNTTSDGNPVELFLDGSGARLNIANGRSLAFDALIVARSDGGASAAYQVRGVIENNAGAVSFIGTPTVSILGEDVAAWNLSVVAENISYDALIIRVTGAASTTIRWVATMHTAEVAW